MISPSDPMTKILSAILIAFGLYFVWIAGPTLAQGPIYVDKDATSGANNGTSWANAYTDLQDALGTATTGDEIWVATGVYTPGLSRSDTFTLTAGIQLYGGFVATETTRSERDWDANLTILSGDIAGDDLTDTTGVVTDTDNINNDNSYHVIWAAGTVSEPITETTVLDGFTITAGQANGVDEAGEGGGFFCDASGSGNVCSPTLSNLSFTGNTANSGGAIFNSGENGNSSPTLSDVTFYNNTASNGGAMYNYGSGATGSSSPTLDKVIFAENKTLPGSGGAIYNWGTTQGNTAPSLSNVLFSGNVAVDGGAIYSWAAGSGSSNPTFTNVTFSGNTAMNVGGVMYADGSDGSSNSPSLSNVIMWGNSAGSRGDLIYNYGATPVISYSLIQSDTNTIVNDGGTTTYGPGILTDNPLWTNPLGPDGAGGTLDDDLSLKDGSPAIDAGDNSVVTEATDLAGDTRIRNSTVDLGAYEALVFSLTLNQTGTGSGTVTVDPDQSGYYNGTVITLTAVADTNHTFSWSGDLSGSTTSTNLTMDSDKVVTVTFSDIEVAYPIVDTAQNECYDEKGIEIICPSTSTTDFYGQDAQHTGYIASYIDNGDDTTTDNVTDLMWQQSPDTDGDNDIDADDKLTYTAAQTYCDNLTLAGYDDWRLPDLKQLYSLMDFNGTDISGYDGTDTTGFVPFLDTTYFDFAYGDTDAGERLIDSQYASNTLYVSNTANDGGSTLFGVNFADGRIKGYGLNVADVDATFFVICVRDNASYGVNDFSDNGDSTITDKATGLMWAQDDSGEGLDWEAALAWVAQKNNETYLGYSDWRLPNAKELQSLLDYTRSPDTTNSAAIDALFNASTITNNANETDYPYYWASTTHLKYTNIHDQAVYLSFGRAMGYLDSTWQDVHGAGAQRSDPKSGDPNDYPTGNGPQGDAVRIFNYVRLVRDAAVEVSEDNSKIYLPVIIDN